MAEAVQLLIRPDDPTSGYIVWDHGLLDPFGSQPPTDESTVMFTDRVIGAQILNWDTPSGAVFRSDGMVTPFGGAVWENVADLPSWPLYVKIVANPSGTNQGYKFRADGHYTKWGVGTPDLFVDPPVSGHSNVRDVELEWTSKAWLMLRGSGEMNSSTGITGYNAILRPGRDVYRALAIREWDATPGFWTAEMTGPVANGNGAEWARRSIVWPGRDAVRDLVVVSDGMEGRPLILAQLVAWGGIARWTVSDPPVATLVAPESPVEDTTRPPIRWTYSDSTGDGQRAYHVRLFTAAQTSAPGFDETTSPAWREWHAEDPTTFEVVPDRDLANGDWHAFVRVRDTAGDLSDWDDLEFTVDVEPPSTPTLDATPGGAWATTLTIGDAEGTVDVQFTDDPPDDAVREWVDVRGAGVAPDGTGGLLLVDWEAPLNRRRWYRARSRTGTPDETIASPWSDEDSAMPVEPARWVLSAPLTPDMGASALEVVPEFEWSRPVAGGVHRPATRRNAIVVRTLTQSAEATVTARTWDADTHQALDRLLDGTRPLLLRSPYGQHWHVELTGDVQTRMLDGIAPDDSEVTVMRHAHETTFTVVETDRP